MIVQTNMHTILKALIKGFLWQEGVVNGTYT